MTKTNQRLRFGIKAIDAENWLKPDEISGLFYKLANPDDQPRLMTGEDWLAAIMEPKLSEGLPGDLQKLFEVARGSMIYGYLYYPLFTLGVEQLFRVAEASVSFVCKTMHVSEKASFQKKLECLLEHDVILRGDYEMWDVAVRGLRNSSSHPKTQTILAPGQAVDILISIAKLINSLFEHQ